MIQTVTGAINKTDLGAVLMHEHISCKSLSFDAAFGEKWLDKTKLKNLACETLEQMRQKYNLGLMVDGTPIFDIKPYLPYVDCHTDSTGGFTEDICNDRLDVRFKDGITKDRIGKDRFLFTKETCLYTHFKGALVYSARLFFSHNTPLVMKGERINQSAATAISEYTITEPAARAPLKIVDTRLKSNNPNKPQLIAPTITKT